MVHHLTKDKHLDEGSSRDVVYDLGDDELDDMYMMNEEEAMDCYDGVQQFDDDASYDDYMASLDDDY